MPNYKVRATGLESCMAELESRESGSKVWLLTTTLYFICHPPWDTAPASALECPQHLTTGARTPLHLLSPTSLHIGAPECAHTHTSYTLTTQDNAIKDQHQRLPTRIQGADGVLGKAGSGPPPYVQEETQTVWGLGRKAPRRRAGGPWHPSGLPRERPGLLPESSL